jgi:hypothetical protein
MKESSLVRPTPGAVQPDERRHLPAAPQPSIWPPLLAFGATFTLWGLISSYILSVLGAICVCAALIGWIGAIRHERNRP